MGKAWLAERSDECIFKEVGRDSELRWAAENDLGVNLGPTGIESCTDK